MAKPRFRDIKKGKIPLREAKTMAPSRFYAGAGIKIKAYLTDSFMLVMPLMYIVFYVVLGSREAFQEQMLLGWIYIFIPLIIVQTLFMIKTAQTPGYRAYQIQIIDEETGKKPHAGRILFRNALAMISFFSLLGWMMMFFRKDSKTLHDIVSRTAIIRLS